MKKITFAVLVVVGVCLIAASAFAVKKEEKSGEALFITNCKVCHPDGGNIVNPAKTLHKKDREAHTIKTIDDIIKTMRNPGPGMTKFDEKTISNHDAKEIAEYIFKTF
jgi:cytochrome c6